MNTPLLLPRHQSVSFARLFGWLRLLATPLRGWAQCFSPTTYRVGPSLQQVVVGNRTIRLLLFVLLSAWGGYLQAQTPGVVTAQRFTYTGQIVTWTVPTGITSLTIEARGAEGGEASSSTLPAGKGAIISGTVAVAPGQSLSILVGGQPAQSNNGGGGSFVVTTDNTPLVIAGGGGGSGFNNDSEQKHGQTTTSGGAGAGGGGAGGVDGQGGKSTSFNTVRYGAGGGLRTDGEGDGNRGGKAFVNGGTGGFNGLGGFGGGGLGTGTSNGGGGGGYSGGGVGGATGIFGVGGGGGSFTAGTRLVALSGTTDGNLGNGLVTITYALPAIRYVKQGGSGTGDGTSWTNASGDLQSQIIAPGVEQVWVAAGTYKPTTGTNRSSSFFMKEAVALYGGFVGNETILSQRPTINSVAGQPSSTTLSGDIGTPGDNSDNTYHVISNNRNYGVNLTSRAVLDGFVITGGNANGSEPMDRGAGIFNINSSPTLLNCSLVGNSAINGGGIFNQSSSPTLTNCGLVGNTATAYGGGILSLNNSRPILTNCNLAVNTANDGGGMVNINSNPVLTNCSFLNNRAGSFGGAMYNGSSRPSLTNCSLQANVARLGGAIAVLGNSQATLTNGSLQSNTATASGGAFFSDNSDLLLTNCSLQNNLSSVGSGNVLAAQNGGRRVLTNCVVYSNGVGTAFGAPVEASYCLFENRETNYSGSNNRTTTVSPFVSTASVALNSCAPAINTGSNEAYAAAGGPASDLAGNPRIMPAGGVIDMGAVEFQDTPNPQTAFTQSPADLSVCQGSSLSIPFSVSGTGPFSVQLYREGMPVGAPQSSPVLSLTNLQPADAGSYVVAVTGACNSVTSTAFSVGVTPLPVAGLTNNGPLSCAQMSVTLTATGGSTYSFSGPGLNQSGTANTAPVSQPGIYTVTVANASGCTSTTSVTVSRDQTPPQVSISPSTTAICAGQTTTLTAGGGDLYRWSTGATTAVISVSASGPYSVTATRSDNGCSASATANLTVNPRPVITVTDPAAVCTPATVNLNPAVSVYAAGSRLAFFTDAGGSSPLVSPAAVAASGTYSVRATSPAGCVSDLKPINVTINPLPTSSLTNDGPMTCTKPSVTLTASGGSTGTTLTYQFSAGATLTSPNTATVSQAGVYSVTVTGANGCSATVSTTVSSNTATPSVTISPAAPTVCAGSLTTLTAGGGDPGAPLAYRWSTGATTASISVSATASTTYSVTATTSGGCSATASARLTVNPRPAAPYLTSVPRTLYTTNFPIPLLIYALPTGFGLDLRFYQGSTNARVDPPVIRPTQPGTFDYYATQTDSKGCVSAPAVFSLKVLEGGTLVSKPADRSVCAGSSTVLSVTATGGNLKYSWYEANPDTPLQVSEVGSNTKDSKTANLTINNVRQTKLYYCLVIGDKGIGVAGPIKVNLRTNCGSGARVAAGEPTESLQVRVLGNPVTGDELRVAVEGAEGQPMRLSLIDQQGRSVSERLVEQAKATEQQTLPIGHQPAGLLLLQVSTPTQSQTVKVLKR